MKLIIYILVTLLFLSCKVQNQKLVTAKNNLTENKVSAIEREIISEFLTSELKKDRYKHKKNYQLVVIEEAIKKQKTLQAYLYSLDEWKVMNKNNELDNSKSHYFFSLSQLEKIKKELESEEVYYWKESDFTNLKVSILKFEDMRKTTNTSEYLRGNLIIFISRPLIINKKNAFISFDIGNGDFGYGAITHFTVLMRKVKNKWVDRGHYEDGVYN